MKAIIALMFLAAVAVCAKAEMEYHPQAVLHYLEMEDRKMVEKVRSIVKLEEDFPKPSLRPSFRPSFRPSGFPAGMPPAIVSTVVFYAFTSKNIQKQNPWNAETLTASSAEEFSFKDAL